MDIRIGPIQIFVSDIERSEKWYTKIIGLKLVKRYPKFKCILMKLNDTEFGYWRSYSGMGGGMG